MESTHCNEPEKARVKLNIKKGRKKKNHRENPVDFKDTS